MIADEQNVLNVYSASLPFIPGKAATASVWLNLIEEFLGDST